MQADMCEGNLFLDVLKEGFGSVDVDEIWVSSLFQFSVRGAQPAVLPARPPYKMCPYSDFQ